MFHVLAVWLIGIVVVTIFAGFLFPPFGRLFLGFIRFMGRGVIVLAVVPLLLLLFALFF